MAGTSVAAVADLVNFDDSGSPTLRRKGSVREGHGGEGIFGTDIGAHWHC